MKPIITKKRSKKLGRPKMIIIGIISYLVLIPILFFDVVLETYHRICFKMYKLPYVDRRKYIRLDRGKLKYLGFWDKINCIYCGYANGFIYYAYTIISETEKYWCPIKHEKRKNKIKFEEPPHHKDFAEFDDEDGLKKNMK